MRLLLQSVEIYHHKMQDQNCILPVNLCFKDAACPVPRRVLHSSESRGQQKGQHEEKYHLIQPPNRDLQLRLSI